ncbi:MAG: cupin [Pseudomonadota bacterium]
MTPATQYLFANLPSDRTAEHFADLFTAPGLRLERIVSHGHTTPDGEWYDQAQGERVMVVQGAARLLIEGEAEERTLGPGDHLYLGPHVRHRVTWTAPGEDTIWLALFHDADGTDP